MFDKNSIINALNVLGNDKHFQAAMDNIKPGKFKRDAENPDYESRLIYTEKLRDFVYNPIALNHIFTDNLLKKTFFRTFGYKGQMDFTIYPNTWLRDLPLLDIGEKVYLGDGIVLGTNLVSPDQEYINVGRIKIGRYTIFNQHCMVGYHTTIGAYCIIDVRTLIGGRTHIGDHTKIEAAGTIGHSVHIGSNVSIPPKCIIGSFSIIEDEVRLKENTSIPSFSLVTKEGIFSRKKKSRYNVAKQKHSKDASWDVPENNLE